jgi:hypothetical protein
MKTFIMNLLAWSVVAMLAAVCLLYFPFCDQPKRALIWTRLYKLRREIKELLA